MYKTIQIILISFLALSSTHSFSQGIKANIPIIQQITNKNIFNFLQWYGLDNKAKKSFVETMVGKIYYQGKFIKQNEKEALKLFKVAADDGFKEAQFNLAVLYEEGKIVEQNYEEAMKWHTAAAQQGHVESQFHLGLIHIKLNNKDNDLGNDKELIKWWSLAANNGHPQAKYWLNFIAQSEKDNETL